MKIVRVDKDHVVGVFSNEEADHLSKRLSVSSFKTFAEYRKENGLSGYHRHPFAEEFNTQLEEANEHNEEDQEEEDDC